MQNRHSFFKHPRKRKDVYKNRYDPEKPKKWLEPKDYFTISISLLALFVTAIGSYFSIIRVFESVNLISSKEPTAVIKGDSLALPIASIGQLTLSNSGNTPVIITNIRFTIIQPQLDEKPHCKIDRGVMFEYGGDPILIRQNDVIFREFKTIIPTGYFTYSTIAKSDDKDFYLFPIESHNKGKDEILIDVCLHITLSTPSTRLAWAEIPVFRYVARANGWHWGRGQGPLQLEPTPLISRTGTVFERSRRLH